MTEEQERMILDNEKLIYHVLKKYGIYNKLDDYFDLCMIGLCKGVKTFDKSKGFAESTYLIRCISNELNMYFRHKRVKTISFDENITELDSDVCLKIENVIADKDINIESDLAKKDMINKMYLEVQKLEPRQKFIILGLYFSEGKISQKEIAKKLNITQSNVSRIKNKALKTLKERLK